MTAELVTKKRLGIFAGRSCPELSAEIAALLNEKLGGVEILDFASGETYCRFEDSVRDTDVFIVQTHGAPVNDNVMEHLLLIDAAKRASAKRITAVAPYFGYARQDRKARPREPISARMLANMFEVAGAQRLITVEMHSGQMQGFFNTPVDHLTAMPVLEEYIREHVQGDAVIVSPDAGRVKTAERFGQRLGFDIAFAHKRRPKGSINTVERGEIIGDVSDKLCIVIDDLIDTAGTVCAAASTLREKGATDVWIMATHGLLSGPAVERLMAAPVSRVVLTNTIPLPSNAKFDKLHVLSIAGVLSAAIESVFEGSSVSSLFQGENVH